MRFIGQRIVGISCVIVCLLQGAQGFAQDAMPISITNAWAHPEGVFYLTLSNPHETEMRLIEVSASLAVSVDFPMITLAPDETLADVAFRLSGLAQPLPLESAFQVTLTFEAENLFQVTLGLPVVTEYPTQSHLQVEATEVWMPPLVSEVGSIYLSLYNSQATQNHLVGVYIAGYEAVSLHETLVDDREVMRMRGLSEGIPIIGNGKTNLTHGGYHIMLEDVANPPKVGDTLFARVEFASGEIIPMGIPVDSREMTINGIDGATRTPATKGQNSHALLIVTLIASGLLMLLLLIRYTMTNGRSD